MAIAVPAVIQDARRRQRIRRRGLGAIVLAAAVAVTATWGLGGLPGDGGPATTTTFHSADGWAVTYPSTFHRWAFEVSYGPAITRPASGFDRGVAIANFAPIPMDAAAPPTGVLFQLYMGNVSRSGGKGARLPLTLRDFPLFAVDPAHVRKAGPGSYDFQVDGHSFEAVIVAGRNASRADLRALSEVISSVRFRR